MSPEEILSRVRSQGETIVQGDSAHLNYLQEVMNQAGLTTSPVLLNGLHPALVVSQPTLETFAFFHPRKLPLLNAEDIILEFSFTSLRECNDMDWVFKAELKSVFSKFCADELDIFSNPFQSIMEQFSFVWETQRTWSNPSTKNKLTCWYRVTGNNQNFDFHCDIVQRFFKSYAKLPLIKLLEDSGISCKLVWFKQKTNDYLEQRIIAAEQE